MPINHGRSPTSPCMSTSFTLSKARCPKAIRSRDCFSNRWGRSTKMVAASVIKVSTPTRITAWVCIRNLPSSAHEANDDVLEISGGHRPPLQPGVATVGALYERPRVHLLCKAWRSNEANIHFAGFRHDELSPDARRCWRAMDRCSIARNPSHGGRQAGSLCGDAEDVRWQAGFVRYLACGRQQVFDESRRG